MYAALQDRPEKEDGKLSGHTVLHVHRILREALKQAVRWQLLAVNPHDAVEPPRRARKEMKALSEAETAELPQRTPRDTLPCACAGAVSRGLRRGELLGHRWQDLDLEAGKLSVWQALELTSDGIKFKTPKTPKSRRLIAPPS